MRNLDIIIPVKNEEKNVPEIVKQVHLALNSNHIKHQIIIVVDKSTDNTLEVAREMTKNYTVTVHKKMGLAGKGYSILEGMDLTDSEYIGFIDGDLQYSPSALPEMYLKTITGENIGAVVANRKTFKNASFIRKLGSRLYAFFLGRVLLGLNCDIQSGLKIFKKDVIKHIDRSLVTAWTFDIPLLHAVKELGYDIAQVDITFENRREGTSKVSVLKTAIAIAKCALKVRFSKRKTYYLSDVDTAIGSGLVFKRKRYVTHSKLHHDRSALYTLSSGQSTTITLIVVAIAAGLYFNYYITILGFISVLSFIYFVDMVFNFYLVSKSLVQPPELEFSKQSLTELNENELPVYTVLCPLYKEWEVIEQFVGNIGKMDWPKDKLEVLLLLEENDTKTIEVANSLTLPAYVKTVIVPHSMPKTKPKACNYGLHKATGEFVVIYDAEDQPEPEQLKKAYLAFKTTSDNTFCVQAKLNYYNPSHNLLTRLFTAEYSLWFDIILPSLQTINTTIPLGGTSNHFRVEALKGIHGWDPFNVTEDCDLGVRIFKDGYKTAIVNSVTLEEANSNVKNWIRQRSRWLKGYMQTYFVHMRDPFKFFKRHGIHALIFQLIIGLRISFILINPILWMVTLSYFVFYSVVGPTIESFYPAPVFYMAALSLIFGNFTYLYNYMIGLAKREHWSLIKYVFFVPFYWVMMSISAIMAFWQLIFNPHHWEKTHHGLHLNKKVQKVKAAAQIVTPSKPKFAIKFPQIRFGLPVVSEKWKFVYNMSKLQKMLPVLENGGLFLIIAGVLGNFIGYLYNAFLSRQTSLEDFGLVSLMGGFIFVTTIPLSALSRAVTHKTAFYLGKYRQPIYDFWLNTRKRTIGVGILLMLFWISISPFLGKFFNTPSYMPFILFSPVWFFSAVNAVDMGYLNGNLKFKILGVLSLAEGFFKFLITYVLVKTNHVELMYISFPISNFVSLVVAYLFARKIKPSQDHITDKKELEFPTQFFSSSIFYKFSSVAYLSFDIILAKHFLNPESAGQYALIALIGKMIYFISGLFGQFVNPLISKEIGQKLKGHTTFYRILAISTLASSSVYVVVGLFGRWVMPILFGTKVLTVVQYLPLYGLGMLCFSIASSIVSYQQVKDKNLITYLSFAISLVQIALIGFYHSNIEEVVEVMAAIGVFSLVSAVVLHYYEEEISSIWKNLPDLLDLFNFHNANYQAPNGKLNILFLNWYDTKHAWGGGAELYMHNIAKRLVEKGYGVTVFCGNDRHNPRYEFVDGVQVIRRGGLYSVAVWAMIYYIFRFRGKYDLIVDVAKGVPFFAPLYANIPVIGLVHHVHQEMFRTGLKFPLKQFSMWLENTLMPRVYKNTHMMTVSESTKKAMQDIGLGRNIPIKIIYNGAEVEKVNVEKTTYPSVMYVGRLRFYKRVDVLIEAVNKLLPTYPDLKLTIAGAGESEKDLKDLVRSLKMTSNVDFEGKVTEQRKAELLTKSWVAVQPSIVEGWGITNIEANLCGTPVVASDVEGLRESVLHNETGLLVEATNVDKFATAIESMITNEELREKFVKKGYQWANYYSWDNSTNELISFIYSTFDFGTKDAGGDVDISLEQEGLVYGN